jgi:hypothetical protein
MPQPHLHYPTVFPDEIKQDTVECNCGAEFYSEDPEKLMELVKFHADQANLDEARAAALRIDQTAVNKLFAAVARIERVTKKLQNHEELF